MDAAFTIIKLRFHISEAVPKGRLLFWASPGEPNGKYQNATTFVCCVKLKAVLSGYKYHNATTPAARW